MVFCLVWKRLEKGGFKWPPIMDGMMQLSPAQLAALIEGLDWTRVHVPENSATDSCAVSAVK